jgi:hypothetical protein
LPAAPAISSRSPALSCDDDANSAFASCGHAAALALGSYVPEDRHACR